MDTHQSTINERFQELISILGKSNNAFAISIGKTSTTINNIVDGKSKPGYELLEAIFSVYPQVSRDWLIMGEGEPIRNKQADGGNQMIEKIEHFLSTKYEQLLEQKNSVIADQRFMIEMLKGQLGKLDGVIEEAKVILLWGEKEEIGQSA
ncbi:hypothetical protein GVN20_24810 [Runella sp. CRIBMP]|uniref:helix-turn-helix domain-containing protein n=1 Tax=Runella sp. CRIBMP TaxID=2683261 RepID=UPI001413709A|nr:helix-turn-helix transcriptional regulator [Runella sp. CRIBMP]NBB22599.1 hypothetical protein [Runella sp. CRIBMP]